MLNLRMLSPVERSKFDEVCENCIWWRSDATGMQGDCEEPGRDPADTRLVIGRYEDCMQILVRHVNIPLPEVKLV